MNKLTITQDENGRFTADAGGPGSPTVGRGASVLEAVGDYAIQTQLVEVKCEPPAVLNEYRVDMDYDELELKPPFSR